MLSQICHLQQVVYSTEKMLHYLPGVLISGCAEKFIVSRVVSLSLSQFVT